MRKYAIGYAIFMGAGMLGMWATFLATGQVPEVRSAPIALTFHLAAEALTALTLLIAGLALARRKPWARDTYLVALGLLGYTVTVSPGYFAQTGQWAFVGMFAAFGIGGLFALKAVLAADKLTSVTQD